MRTGLFIDTFEKQFHTKIPPVVCRALELFWATADDATDIIKEYADKNNTKNYNLQLRHKSLNATTLKAYDEHLYNALLRWFIDNAYEIAKLSFSMGAALDSDEWSDFVWYINLLEENDIDNIFFIEDICKSAQMVANAETYFGSSFGGTTIQLPFGFVEWHHGKLQFHHRYEKVKALVEKLCKDDY